ncbi:Sexual differentiation process protein isp4 [Penicillium subrubescens]|uniref:Sexual differentiation process protein isp4 n=1 Tax=Penicillium subrubescens TaxID=1316194 RepID=A0A1Q5TAS6_9EURO|nr:Sexual differentiation process protein isp4 [Penicillium subrubescens]
MSLNSDKRAKGDIQELHNIELSHQWDPNLPQEKLDEIYEAVKTGDHEKAAELDKAFVQDSQYEEVRAAVHNTDGGEPANTVRAWVLGMLFTTVGSGLNMFLSMRPAAMIWPGQFANTALFYALHDKRIKPNSVVLNQLFGGFTGLSLIPITFDWTYVSAYLLDPLLSPVHAIMNTSIGLVVFVLITTIGIAYTGAFYSEYLPINTSSTYDNTQHSYNVSKILGAGFTFDEEAYKAYSPMFLAPTFALNYGLSFAALTAVIVHIILFHRKEIWHRFRAAQNQEPDIHLILMKKYREVPDWWYAALFLASVALGLAGILGYDSQLPWWGFFVSIIVGAVFIIPTCMILGITNIQLSLNVLSPFLAGFMIPGKPIGVMVFKVFSTITLGQAQYFCADLKIGHYMKVPPRVTFMCQVVATVWACFVQIAVMNWTLDNIENVCTTTQTAHFTCPNGKAFFSSSIVWGVIGPNRMFGPDGIYNPIQYFWLIGALLPVLFYVLMRLFPRSKARLLNAPV